MDIFIVDCIWMIQKMERWNFIRQKVGRKREEMKSNG
jgi:hypothetical protein